MMPEVGMLVCDCRLNHQRIVSVDPDDDDMVVLEDGWRCSFHHCCDMVPHDDWDHADVVPTEDLS